MTLKKSLNIPVQQMNPVGKNSLNSRSKFVQRKYYDEKFNYIINVLELSENYFFDSRGNEIYYGRLDNNNNIINLTENNIKDLKSNSQLYSLKYVADAFDELQYWCRSYGQSGTFTNPYFINLKPKKAWLDFNTKYHDHITKIYDLFLQNLKLNNKNLTIKNVSEFLNHFIMFVDLVAGKTPIIKSSYLMSRECDISDTGFCIEIDTAKKDDDKKKMQIIQDPDFSLFVLTCLSCGFVIDKQCPWRLIFDYNNVNSLKYMNKYDINPSNVFSTFNKTQEYDIENLISYIVILYNTFVQSSKFALETHVVVVDERQYTAQMKIEREIADVETVRSSYGDNFWKSLYFYILLVESKVDLSQAEYDTIDQRLLNLYNSVGLTAALRDLSNIISQHDKTDSKKYRFFKALDHLNLTR